MIGLTIRFLILFLCLLCWLSRTLCLASGQRGDCCANGIKLDFAIVDPVQILIECFAIDRRQMNYPLATLTPLF